MAGDAAVETGVKRLYWEDLAMQKITLERDLAKLPELHENAEVGLLLAPASAEALHDLAEANAELGRRMLSQQQNIAECAEQSTRIDHKNEARAFGLKQDRLQREAERCTEEINAIQRDAVKCIHVFTDGSYKTKDPGGRRGRCSRACGSVGLHSDPGVAGWLF